MNSILELKKYLSLLTIKSDIPGRIRIKLSVSSLKISDLNEIKKLAGFEKILINLPGIESVRVNPIGLSCIITYNQNIISQKALRDLINNKKSVESDKLINLIELKFKEWKTA